MTKRLICLLMSVICLLASMSSIGVFAENTTEEPAIETILSDSREEALLNYLGVKTDNALDLNEEIPRGEFAAMLAPIVSYNAAKGNADFDDVTSAHEFFDGISDVAGASVMTGTSDGRFSPDEKLIYSHALIAVTRMLELEAVAKTLGSDIEAYKKILTYLGLKLRVSEDVVITRHMAYDLIYDALFTNTVNMDKYLLDRELVKDKDTFLKKKMDIISVSGQLTDNGITAIDGNSSVKKENVLLGDTEMHNFAAGIEEYLGYELDCYIRENDDEYTIVYFTPSAKNEIVEFYTDDCISSDNSCVTYDDGNKQKKIKLSSDLNVIYNGKYDPTFQRSDFKLVNGKITFLKPRGYSDYSLAFVHDEEIFVVSRVNSIDIKITSDMDEALALDEDCEDINVSYYYGGEKSDFSKITADDVLTIEKSRDKTVYRIYISDTEVTGIPSSLNKDGAVVDGNYYKFSSYYLSRVAALDYVKLETGRKNLIYLDYRGRIVKINARVLRDTYGWLEKVYLDDLEDSAYVKMYTETGELKTFAVKNKVKFNGTKTDSAAIVASPLLKNGSATVRQLITYKENSDEEITEINTAADMTGVADYIGYTEDRFTYDYYNSRSAFRTGVFSQFDFRKYYISASTVVFIIPAFADGGEDKFAVKTGKYFQHNTIYQGINVYDVQSNTVPNVIVLYTSEDTAVSDVQDGSSVCIFKGTTEKVNEYDEACLIMEGFDSNGKFELETENDDVCDSDGAYYPSISGEENKYRGLKLKNLPEGAVIQYALNAYGRINDIRVIQLDGVTPYDTWTMTRGSSGNSTIRDSMMNYVNNNFFQYGRVEEIHSGIMVYSINGIKYPIAHSDTRKVVIVDNSLSRNKIRIGTGADIEQGDMVFIKTSWANLNYVFCIKG